MKGMDTTTIVCIKHTSGVYFMKINEKGLEKQNKHKGK